jgi:hypothetical protein
MAFAIMGGLFVATMLTLLVLPVFYIMLYRAKQPATTAAAIYREMGSRGTVIASVREAILGNAVRPTTHGSPRRFAPRDEAPASKRPDRAPQDDHHHERQEAADDRHHHDVLVALAVGRVADCEQRYDGAVVRQAV